MHHPLLAPLPPAEPSQVTPRTKYKGLWTDTAAAATAIRRRHARCTITGLLRQSALVSEPVSQ